MRFYDLGCLLTSNQLTLSLPWVKARTGGSGPDPFPPPRKKGKGRLRETRVNRGWIQSETLGWGLVEIITFLGSR